jgi:hypothetical protein
MSNFFDLFMDQGEFKMDQNGILQFRKWEEAFEAYGLGVPRERFQHSKHALQGWDAAQKISKFKEQLEHSSSPGDPLVIDSQAKTGIFKA